VFVAAIKGLPMLRLALSSLCIVLLAGCQSVPPHPPLRAVPAVDLQRYMGDWYVIAHIPTFIEKDAYNAVESYRLNEDGTIATTFHFNRGAPNGPLQTYNPTGFVYNTATNSEWRMQFMWPAKAEYLITYLDENYQHAIVARSKRDNVWILARTTQISDTDYAMLQSHVRAMGYDLSLLRRVPQQ
jgi:apolipoprotein D and lipocalin family protein